MRHPLNTIANICKYTAFSADSKTICRHSGGVSRYNTKKSCNLGLQDFFCRGDRIRTCDHLVPNQVRYRTALRPAILVHLRCKDNAFFYIVQK